jgi:hypothetical protein
MRLVFFPMKIDARDNFGRFNRQLAIRRLVQNFSHFTG